MRKASSSSPTGSRRWTAAAPEILLGISDARFGFSKLPPTTSPRIWIWQRRKLRRLLGALRHPGAGEARTWNPSCEVFGRNLKAETSFGGFGRKVGLAGQSSAPAPDGVFSAAFSPGAVRIAEECFPGGVVFEPGVLSKLGSFVEGDRSHRSADKMQPANLNALFKTELIVLTQTAWRLFREPRESRDLRTDPCDAGPPLARG